MGSAALVGVNGLTISGTLGARVNRMGRAVDRTVDVQGTSVHVKFDDGTDITQWSGSATLAVADFVSVSGDFAFERSSTTNGDVTTTEILVAVANTNIFLGANANTNRATGVKITGAKLGLVIRAFDDVSTSTQSDATYAFLAEGSAALVGIDGLHLSGSLSARVNRMGAPIDKTIDVNGTLVRVKFDTAAEVVQLSGDVSLQIADFVTVSGAFAFESVSETMGTKTTTRITAAAADIDIFMGANAGTEEATGVQITGAKLGLVMRSVTDTAAPTQEESKYALVAEGAAALIGVDGLTVTGRLAARVNRMGAPVDETIYVRNTPVRIKFDDSSDIAQFAGNVSLQVADFVSVSGSFAFESESKTVGTATTTVITAAAADIDIFLGANAGAANAVGVSISDASFGLVLQKVDDTSLSTQADSTYALWPRVPRHWSVSMG